MQFVVGQLTGIEEADGRLTGVQVTDADGDVRDACRSTMLLVFFGL